MVGFYCKKDAGGLVGWMEKGTISDCYNTGGYVCSFLGGNVGGIAGTIGLGSIERCYNDGRITSGSSGSDSVGGGGIVGMSINGTISSCCNLGKIEATGSKAHGGIVGVGNGEIRDCYNYNAETLWSAPAGGIIGRANGTVSISNCYNFGDIHRYNSGTFEGGIVGEITTSSTLSTSNCYFLNQIRDEYNYKALKGVGNIENQPGIEGKEEGEMKAESFLTVIKGTENNPNWKRDPNKNEGLPILSWQ